ncbi:hypothetical protein Tco_1014119 [Tanacetum coccineum]
MIKAKYNREGELDSSVVDVTRREFDGEHVKNCVEGKRGINSIADGWLIKGRRDTARIYQADTILAKRDFFAAKHVVNVGIWVLCLAGILYVVLSDKEKYYYKTVIDNMHRLPVEGYKQVSKRIGVRQELVERCVRHYFYNESKNRSPEIQARAIKAMVAIKLTQKGELLENIAPVLDVDVESARQYVMFFYAFREKVLKKETIQPTIAQGTNQNNNRRIRRGLHLKRVAVNLVSCHWILDLCLWLLILCLI